MRVSKVTWLSLGLALSLVCNESFGVVRTWTPTSGDSFYEPANWTPNGAPGASDDAVIDDPAVTSVINFAGTMDLGAFNLGTTGATGGNVLFSGGTLNVAMDQGTKSHIGDQSSLNSTFTMTGSAVLNLDEPLSGGGNGLGSDGDGQDLEIGAQTGAFSAKGSFIMQDDTVMRISDDLKIGAEDNGNGEVILSGNAQAHVGSGVAVSESSAGVGYLEVGGNALLSTGNSSAPGDTANGLTNEGYLTLTSSNGGSADVLIKDSGTIYTRTLQMRDQTANITIQDNGQLHVFDNFANAAPDLGNATVSDDGSFKTSHVAQSNGGVFNLVLTDSAKFSVDSAGDLNVLDYEGLALSGGNNNGFITASGGKSTLDIQDQAEFIIQHDLNMTIANDALTEAESTLRVTGPDATVRIVDDLIMSRDPFNPESPASALEGKSTIAAVITGSDHTTIEVGDVAYIENGSLAVELDGYSPAPGDSYTLLTAATIDGASFKETDFTLAPLAEGLDWELTIDATSVELSVIGTLVGDFNGDGSIDGQDFLFWQRNPTVGDLSDWQSAYNGGGPLSELTTIPEPSTLSLMLLGMYFAARVRRSR